MCHLCHLSTAWSLQSRSTAQSPVSTSDHCKWSTLGIGSVGVGNMFNACLCVSGWEGVHMNLYIGKQFLSHKDKIQISHKNEYHL